MNRKLADEEKNACTRMIRHHEEQKAYWQYLLEYSELMLAKGLAENYKKQRIEFELKKRECVKEISDAEMQVLTLKRQVEEGVPIKEQKSGG